MRILTVFISGYEQNVWEQHNVNQTPHMERLSAPPDTLLA